MNYPKKSFFKYLTILNFFFTDLMNIYKFNDTTRSNDLRGWAPSLPNCSYKPPHLHVPTP